MIYEVKVFQSHESYVMPEEFLCDYTPTRKSWYVRLAVWALVGLGWIRKREQLHVRREQIDLAEVHKDVGKAISHMDFRRSTCDSLDMVLVGMDTYNNMLHQAHRSLQTTARFHVAENGTETVYGVKVVLIPHMEGIVPIYKNTFPPYVIPERR